MKKLTFTLFLLSFMATLCQAQDVFADAYTNDLFGNRIIFTGHHDLLIAGTKEYSGIRPTGNLTDFGLMRVNDEGVPLMTKVYHFAPWDQLKYVQNFNQGHVIGGNSRRSSTHLPNSGVVIARTNSRGIVNWSRIFYPGHGNGIAITGLATNPANNDIVFGAVLFRHPTATTPTLHRDLLGVVVKLNAAGQVQWMRFLSLGNKFLIDKLPTSNIALTDSGHVLSGWNFGRVNSASTFGRHGVAFRAYTTAGVPRWTRAFRANGLLSMTYTPNNNGIAAYGLDSLNRSGLIKLNGRGQIQFAFLDNNQTSGIANRGSSIKYDNGKLPYSLGQKLTMARRVQPSSSPAIPLLSFAGIRTKSPAIMKDFVTDGRAAYIISKVYYPPQQKFYPVLLKSAFAKNVDNCFTKYEETKARPVFPLPRLHPVLDLTNLPVNLLRDSAITLRTASITTLDSLACVGNGDVWPGDANSDGIAEAKDITTLGLAWGSTGPQRPNATFQWIGQPARNWSQTFFHGANYKHADCNGNGTVGFGDILLVLANYGRTHNKNFINGTADDAPLGLRMPETGIATGQTLEIPVYLGDEHFASGNIHGLSFSIFYDPAMVQEDISFELTPSWLGTPDEDLISMQKCFYEDGQLDIGITRLNRIDAHGNGPIGILRLQLQPEVTEGQELRFEVTQTSAINAAEEEFLLNGQTITFEVGNANQNGIGTAIEPSAISRDLIAFPNPVQDVLTIESSGLMIQKLTVISAFGQRMLQREVEASSAQLSLQHLPKGIYFVKIFTDEGIAVRRVVKH